MKMRLREHVKILWPQALIALILLVCGYVFSPDAVKVSRADFILNTSITCASTFSGFTLTVVSILLGFSRSALLEYLKQKGGIKELIFRYTYSLILGFIYVLFCSICGGMLPEDFQIPQKLFIAWGVLAFLYVYNLVSSSAYLLKTISQAADPMPQESDEVISPKNGYRV